MNHKEHVGFFKNPDRLSTPAEIAHDPTPELERRGLYGWYFDPALPTIPLKGCVKIGKRTLLYIGIAGRSAKWGGHLRKRIGQHLNDDSYSSTLRRSLGCLLLNQLRLVSYKRRKSFWFDKGEPTLTQWIKEHARVAWLVHEHPWEIEQEVIGAYSLPLNIKHNSSHPFCRTLRAMRRHCKQEAR